MKFCLSILIIIFTFTGCTSTYKLSESKSPEKFYENCENDIDSRSVKVILSNDSSVITGAENKIISDTLYSSKEVDVGKDYRVPTKELQDISFTANDYKTADIALKNGEKLKAKNLFLANDTANFWGIKTLLMKNMISPLSEVKSIEYKNNLKGFLPGILVGAFSGGILGATGWIYHPMEGGNIETFSQGEATFAGVYTGMILGAIIGYLIGIDVEYQFNK